MDDTFIIRSVRESDLEELYRLAQMVYFINLPADREIISEKIRVSIESFTANIVDKFKREYIFVMEDLSDQTLVGTSMIIARHGSPDSPHMSFQHIGILSLEFHVDKLSRPLL